VKSAVGETVRVSWKGEAPQLGLEPAILDGGARMAREGLEQGEVVLVEAGDAWRPLPISRVPRMPASPGWW